MRLSPLLAVVACSPSGTSPDPAPSGRSSPPAIPSAAPSATLAAAPSLAPSAAAPAATAPPFVFPRTAGTTTLFRPWTLAKTHEISEATLDAAKVPWGDLAQKVLRKKHTLSIELPESAAFVRVPPCAGVETISLDGREVLSKASLAKSASRLENPWIGAPRVLATGGAKHLELALDIGDYEKRIACGFGPSYGAKDDAQTAVSGVGLLSFASSNDVRYGAGRAYVYLPPIFAQKPDEPRPVMVAPHPWNGDAATYLRYAELFAAAAAEGVIVLFPSGLGNSLYTAPAETEVMTALAELEKVLPIDSARIGIWGASMGGAGATTIGFHHPDRFNVVASFFGDSRYDRNTYVKSILTSDEAARAVNADDVAENGMHLATILVHGTADKVSEPKQTTLFCDHLKKLGYSPTCKMLPGRGHEGAVVATEIAAVVAAIAKTERPELPAHVRFRTVRAADTSAYGVTLVRIAPDKPAYIDVEGSRSEASVRPNEVRGTDEAKREGDGRGSVKILAAENVKALTLAKGALGLDPNAPVTTTGVPNISVRIAGK